MRPYNVFLIVMLFFIGGTLISMLLGIRLLVDYHEQVHQNVYKDYGINATIWISKTGLSGYTYSIQENAGRLCNRDCMMEQNLVENVGYHSMGILTNLWIMFVLGLAFYVIMSSFNNLISNLSNERRLRNNGHISREEEQIQEDARTYWTRGSK